MFRGQGREECRLRLCTQAATHRVLWPALRKGGGAVLNVSYRCARHARDWAMRYGAEMPAA